MMILSGFFKRIKTFWSKDTCCEFCRIYCAPRLFPIYSPTWGRGRGKSVGIQGRNYAIPIYCTRAHFHANAQAQDVPRMAADAETYWIFLRNLVNPHWLGRCRSARRTLVPALCDTRIRMRANGHLIHRD